MIKQGSSAALGSALALATTFGCSGGAEVKVAFDHQSAHPGALTVAGGQRPGVFGVKLVALYLAEDVDGQTLDNVGGVTRLWSNPACDQELRRCGVGPSAGAYQVKDYFDLALPSEEVNARLNAQGAEVTPGTYRYLRMDMAGIQDIGSSADQTAPNLRFGADPTSAHEVRFHTNMEMLPLDPPLVLTSGDTVTVTLSYDLGASYFSGAGVDENHPPEGTPLSDWYCGGDSGTPARGSCLRFSRFSPSVSHAQKP
jgi:hypothetical protein